MESECFESLNHGPGDYHHNDKARPLYMKKCIRWRETLGDLGQGCASVSLTSADRGVGKAQTPEPKTRNP
jgi:hypothetical protein